MSEHIGEAFGPHAVMQTIPSRYVERTVTFVPDGPAVTTVHAVDVRKYKDDLEAKAYAREAERAEADRRRRRESDERASLVAAWSEIPAEGVLEAVGAMHAPSPLGGGRFCCDWCRDGYNDVEVWPCPTAELILREMGAAS